MNKDSIIFKIKSSISTQIENEIIILNLDTSLYHSLNKSGNLIWEYIDIKGTRFEDLSDHLKKISNYFENNTIEELVIFLKNLESKNLIKIEL